MKFLSYENQTIVNLDNVSSIYFQQRDNTIIFNMNYSVNNVDTYNKDLMVTSAVFWELEDKNEMEGAIYYVKTHLLKKQFFPINNNRFVNLNSVSSIKFDDYNMRVIFNLNFGFNHPKDPNSFVNDFVYLNADTPEEYENNKEEIKDITKLKD